MKIEFGKSNGSGHLKPPSDKLILEHYHKLNVYPVNLDNLN